jgi:hypothetical protein
MEAVVSRTRMPVRGVGRRRAGPGRFARWAAVAVLVTTAALGCSKNDGGESATSVADGTVSATASTPGTTPVGTGSAGSTPSPFSKWTPEQQEVIDAHRAAVDAWRRANQRSDPDDPELLARYGGDVLVAARAMITTSRNNGQASRPATGEPYDIEFIAVQITGDTAVTRTCEVDSDVVYRVKDGAVINDEVSTFRFESTLERKGGAWKMTKRDILQEQSGRKLQSCTAG